MQYIKSYLYIIWIFLHYNIDLMMKFYYINKRQNMVIVWGFLDYYLIDAIQILQTKNLQYFYTYNKILKFSMIFKREIMEELNG